MKNKFGNMYRILLLALFSGNCVAGNLCDAECTLSMSFPAGGAIEALAPLSIGFGSGGLVDTAGSVTAYVDGETLDLNAGESLVFGAGGSFDLGAGGNIAYTSLNVATGGEVSIAAQGGAGEIRIPAGGRLSFSGGAEVNLYSAIRSEGTLYLDDHGILNIFASAASAGCEFTTAAGATISVSEGDALTIDNHADCATVSALFLDSPYLLAGELTVTDLGSNVVVGTLTPIAVSNDAGTIMAVEAAPGSGAGPFGLFAAFLISCLSSWRRFGRRATMPVGCLRKAHRAAPGTAAAPVAGDMSR